MKAETISLIRTVCGDNAANKLELILLQDSTIKQSIDFISENILKQLIIGTSRDFGKKKSSIQVDKCSI